MRFDAVEYLFKWKEKKVFPLIHSNITNIALSTLKGKRGIDVCCSHGLLGTKLMSLGFKMIGVEENEKIINLSKENLIPLPIIQLKIHPSTFTQFFNVVKEHKADFFVMRRCLPELFGSDLNNGRNFFNLAAQNGINEIILEGRVKTVNATNQLSSIDAEVDLLAQSYTVYKKYGSVAYLKVKT